MSTWTKQKLGDIFRLEYGKALVANKRVPGDFPVYGSSGCVGTHNDYFVKGPGIIIGRKGSVGEVYFSNRNFYPIDTSYYIRETDNKFDIKFLYYFLKNYNLKKLQGDVGVPGLNRETVHSEEVFFIDNKNIQTRIASVLSAYDDLLENNEKRIKVLEEMAQLLYTEWFVKFKFPGHEKIKMLDSGTEYGKIPEGWEVRTLGDHILVKKGKNITRDTTKIGSIPVVAGGLEPAYFHDTANTNSPVVTVSASGANAGFTRLYFEDIWASDCSFIDKSVTANVYFYYLFLKSKTDGVRQLQRGSAQPHVYPGDLMGLSIITPPDVLIDKLNHKIEPLFKLIGGISKNNVVLSQARDLLIPQLVTGKRRLKKL